MGHILKKVTFNRLINIKKSIGEVPDNFQTGSGDPLENGSNVCPVCLGTDWEFVVEVNPCVVVKCQKCGFVKKIVPEV